MKFMITFVYGSSENHCILDNSLDVYSFVGHLNDLEGCIVTSVCRLDYEYMAAKPSENK